MTPLRTIPQQVNDAPYTTPTKKGPKIGPRAYCGTLIFSGPLLRSILNDSLQIAENPFCQQRHFFKFLAYNLEYHCYNLQNSHMIRLLPFSQTDISYRQLSIILIGRSFKVKLLIRIAFFMYDYSLLARQKPHMPLKIFTSIRFQKNLRTSPEKLTYDTSPYRLFELSHRSDICLFFLVLPCKTSTVCRSYN